MQCPSCQAEVESGQKFCKGCGGVVPEAEVDPLLGKSIGGKYRIIKLLGEGGMGAVYHGEQQLGTNVRRVAIKTLHKQLSSDAKVKARFQRECGTIAALEHPNTIQVYDFGTTDDGQLYIVMEFVQGKSLADVLEKGGAMEPSRVEIILKQMCGSLEEAHMQGIVHRDLKPDNVVLTDRAGQHDFVKVLDFGIAKRSGEEDKNEAKLTQAGMVLGTPPYMSPEQFTGKPIDARSDIYSIGVMAYEMLTGKLPFEADTAWEWATKHMTAQPAAIEAHASGLRAPEKMRQAVMRALAKPVDQRFATVREFIEAFSLGAHGGTAVLPAKGGTAILQQPSPNASNPAIEPPRVSFQSNPGEPVSARAMTEAGMAAVPPGFMPPPGSGAYGAPPPVAGTPAAGNVSYPTPQGVNAAPGASGANGKKSGGGKVAIFVVLGVLVLGGGGAAAFFATRVPGAAPAASSSGGGRGNAATGGSGATDPSDKASVAPTTPPQADDAAASATSDVDASAAEPAADLDASVPDLDSPDTGKKTLADSGVTFRRDAGAAVVTLHDASVAHAQPAVCREAGDAKRLATLTKRPEMWTDYNNKAARCRAAGGTPP